MVSFAAFAEISGTVIAAVGLALALEWYGVNSLLRLMPAPKHVTPRRAAPAVVAHGRPDCGPASGQCRGLRVVSP
jgi:hypothetical protein